MQDSKKSKVPDTYDDKGNPEEYTYDFFEDFDEDEGIFLDKRDPVGSYGDIDAVEDLTADMVVAPMQFTLGADGLPAPSPPFDAMAIMNSEVAVTDREFVCLAGPCDHYVEQTVKVGGRDTTNRFCLRIRSWAEPDGLNEVDILACSGHESDVETDRIDLNWLQIAQQNKKALEIDGDLGVCYSAGCKHHFLRIIQGLDHEGALQKKNQRCCTLLAGAARPRVLLSFEPVSACTGLEPSLDHGSIKDRLILNKSLIEASRRKFAKEQKSGSRGDQGSCEQGCRKICGDGRPIERPSIDREDHRGSSEDDRRVATENDCEASEGDSLPDFGSDLEQNS
jgi:hypothetical protein